MCVHTMYAKAGVRTRLHPTHPTDVCTFVSVAFVCPRMYAYAHVLVCAHCRHRRVGIEVSGGTAPTLTLLWGYSRVFGNVPAFTSMWP